MRSIVRFKVSIFVLVCLACVVGNASSDIVVYDLVSDWSDTNNPNGQWTYREGENALASVTNWEPGAWNSPQSGWGDSATGNNRLPFWFQSNGAENFTHDWQLGDVVVHTTDDGNGVGNGNANVIWTSPVAGTIDIAGSVWMGRDIGRSNDWSLWINDTQITGGSLFDGDAYDRASPFDMASGSGGAAVLNDISVAAGDVAKLEFVKTSGAGDFVGANFTINLTPVPEPTAAVAISVLGSLFF